MSDPSDNNPYRPPSSEHIPEPVEEAAGGPSDLSEIHKDLWEGTKKMLRLGGASGIIWVIGFVQLANGLLAMLPQLMLGINNSPFDNTTPSISDEQFITFAIVFGVGWVVVMGLMLLSMTLMRPLHRLYFQGESAVSGLGEALTMGLPRLPSMIGFGILAALASLVGLLFCIFPGILVAFAAGLVFMLLITTDKGVFQAISDGRTLLENQWKPYLVGTVIFVGLYMLLSMPISFIALIPTVGQVIQITFTVAMGTISPFFYIALFCNVEERERQREDQTVWADELELKQKAPGSADSW